GAVENVFRRDTHTARSPLKFPAIVALAAASLWACRGDADFSDAAPKTIILSAEEYREDITTIDRLIFENRPWDYSRQGALATRLEQLARRIREKLDSRFLELESLELKRLAEMAKGLPGETLAKTLPDQWMRIRNNLFEDQAWFARSAADLEPAKPTR
ncbi:MAG TPA: hypothetical protein VF376_06200, partial [Thermoanaerobaculia bacterium]